MNKQIYEVNGQGFIIGSYVGRFENDTLIEPTDKEYITTDLPQPLLYYKPRWNDTEWVEGATEEEIDEMVEVDIPAELSELDELTNYILEVDFRLLMVEMRI